MTIRSKAQIRTLRHQQRGAALLIMLTLIVLAASYTLLKRVNAQKPDIVRAADSTRALGQAKAALMGYALRSQVKPGELPCPDYTLDGQSDPCLKPGAHVTLGRLPWVTLGTADLRDASGEQLWYAPALGLESDGIGPINSETTAGLRVDGSASQIAAVIVAPGPSTSTQVRPQNPAAQIDPARYLEDANKIGDVNFVTTHANPNIEFNDQLISITRDELMQAVERRVLREVRAALKMFSDTYGYYPISASSTAPTCDDAAVDEGLLRTTSDAICANVPPFPPWFISGNNWPSLVWYARDPGGSLSADGGASFGIQVLLIAGGPQLGGPPRPPYDMTTLLEGENSDGAPVYEALPIDSASNDQILVVAP